MTSTLTPRQAAVAPYIARGLTPTAAYHAALADLEQRSGVNAQQLAVLAAAIVDAEVAACE